MKIKHIKYTIFIFCIIFLAGFNYFSLAAINDPAKASISIDSDGDGLSDSEESLYGTDPSNPDTDSDGYSDGVEVKTGYNPMKAAPGDKIVLEKETTGTSDMSAASTASLTESFNNDFQEFIASKNGQTISTTDINNFVDSALADKISPTDINSIPTIDKSKLKIIPQTYPSLSAKDRKQKLLSDAGEYVNKIIYLLTSNAPMPINTMEDLNAFETDFMDRVTDFSNPENIAYFNNLGERLDVFSQQLNTVEVPETMVDLHVKFSKLINIALFLKDLSSSSSQNDPMGNILQLTKLKDTITLFDDFFTNDFNDYITKLNES